MRILRGFTAPHYRPVTGISLPFTLLLYSQQDFIDWGRISPPLHTGQHKHRNNTETSMALNRVGIHDLSV
jgi:hypothetical protein